MSNNNAPGGQDFRPQGQQEPLSPAHAKAMKAADMLAFYEWMGRDDDAQSLRRQLANYNAQLEGAGLDPVEIQPLNPDTFRQELTRYSRQGSVQGREAMQQYLLRADQLADERRQEAIDYLGDRGGSTEAKWGALWDTVNGMLEDPIIDRETQRMIEGGIRSEARSAERRFLEQASENLGARLGMGRVSGSGPGLESLGGFKSELGRATQESLRRARIAQVLENRQGEERMAQLLAQVTQGLGNQQYRYDSPLAQLIALPPSVMASTGLDTMAQLMEAIDVMREADNDDPGWFEEWGLPIINAIAPAIGSSLQPFFAGVGSTTAGAAGSAAGAAGSAAGSAGAGAAGAAAGQAAGAAGGPAGALASMPFFLSTIDPSLFTPEMLNAENVGDASRGEAMDAMFYPWNVPQVDPRARGDQYR